MVKIRLRRIGAKGRPFYRVVVSKSTSGRNGAFVETIGTYDPVAQPSVININEERALHWLMEGAQPTPTTAFILKSTGVLPKYIEQRPKASKSYKYLDKAIAVQASPGHTAPEATEKVKAKKQEAPKEAEVTAVEASVAEPIVETVEATPVAEASPAIEEAPIVEATPVAESTPTEEDPTPEEPTANAEEEEKPTE